jgi:uncharacterized protein
LGVIDALVDAADAAADVAIRGVAVGIHYTAVRSRWAGLAGTDRNAARADDPLGPWLGRLAQMRARDVLPLLRSDHQLERTIGLATLNSLFEAPADAVSALDGHSLTLAHARDRHVVTVGRFAFVESLRAVARRVTVLELEPRGDERPAGDASMVLGSAEVVAVTGTTLANGTFDGLVSAIAPGATVILLGPSVPMTPILFSYRVDILAGVVVDDAERLLGAVSQGASRHELHGTRSVVMARSPSLLSI